GRGAAGGLGVREVRHDPARPGDLAERHRLLRDPQVRVQRGAGEGMGYEVPAIPHRREPDPRIAAEPLHQRRGPRGHASGACANTEDDRIGSSRAGDNAGGARCRGRRGERSDRQIQQGEQIVRTRDETVRSIADRTVDPLPFLLPLYRPSLVYQFKLRLGMQLYDWLSLDKSLPKRKYLDRAATLAAEPNLKPDGLTGAWRFYDAQVPLVERLVVENVV